jgi:hypothetical protein
MKFILFRLIFFPLLSVPMTVQAQENSNSQLNGFLETVTYLEYHDPGWMILENERGVKYKADFLYDLISGDDIDQWEKGEKIEFFIKDGSGIGIIRKKTGRFYKLFFSNGPIPVDTWQKTCLEKAKNRLDYEGCYLDIARFWEVEQKYLIQYLKKKRTGKTFIKNLEDSQQRWDGYAAIQRETYTTSRRGDDGTMGSTISALLSAQLEKDRYLHMTYLYN